MGNNTAPERAYMFVDEDGDLLGYSSYREDLIPYIRYDLYEKLAVAMKDVSDSHVENVRAAFKRAGIIDEQQARISELESELSVQKALVRFHTKLAEVKSQDRGVEP